MIKAMRYMDDLFLIIKHNKISKEDSTKVAIGLMTCYHYSMDLEITETGKAVKFLESKIKISRGTLETTHALKNHDSIINHGNILYLKTADFQSYSPMSNKLGTIIGTYCRIHRNCSTPIGLIKSITLANEKLKILGYTNTLIKEALERLYGKTQNKIWRILQKYPMGG